MGCFAKHWKISRKFSQALEFRPDFPGATRLVGYQCMFCHNAYPRMPDGHGEEGAEAQRQRARAMRHALAEYELTTYVLGPDRSLAEALAR